MNAVTDFTSVSARERALDEYTNHLDGLMSKLRAGGTNKSSRLPNILNSSRPADAIYHSVTFGALPPEKRWDYALDALGAMDDDEDFLAGLRIIMDSMAFPHSLNILETPGASQFFDTLKGYMADLNPVHFDRQDCVAVAKNSRSIGYNRGYDMLVVASNHVGMNKEECLFTFVGDMERARNNHGEYYDALHLVLDAMQKHKLKHTVWDITCTARETIYERQRALRLN